MRTYRDTYIHIYIQRNIYTYRHTGRRGIHRQNAYSEANIHTYIQNCLIYTHTGRQVHTVRHTYIHTCIKTYIQTGIPTKMQGGRQTGRQPGRQAERITER